MRSSENGVVRLSGDYDAYSADARLAGDLEPAYTEREVILDFSDVRYMDSSGISALVRMTKSRLTRGLPPPRLAGVHHNVLRIFQIARLDEVWPIYDSVTDAQLSAISPKSS